MRPLDLPCGEQGKLPIAKAFMLAERDKFMSEEEKPKSFMQELDRWTETTIISRLAELASEDFDGELVEEIKVAVRTKVLESYRNGRQAGPRVAKQPQKGGR